MLWRYGLFVVVAWGWLAGCNGVDFEGMTARHRADSADGTPETPEEDGDEREPEDSGSPDPRDGEPEDPGDPDDGEPEVPEDPDDVDDPDDSDDPGDPGDPGDPDPPPPPGTPDPVPPRHLHGRASWSCSSGDDAELILSPDQFTSDEAAREGEQIWWLTLDGEFCPKGFQDLTVLFLVDFSSSMGFHPRPDRGTLHPGNDPLTAGSCGRLQALQAVMDRLMLEKEENHRLQAALIPFAGAVVGPAVINPLPPGAFADELTVDNICRHLLPPPLPGIDMHTTGVMDGLGMGPDGRDISGMTNYGAAFAAAAAMLDTLPGDKVIYFITDGRPTEGGDDPVAAGMAAAEDLQVRVANLTLYGLLLGYEGYGSAPILGATVGSDDHVRIAPQAEDLTTAILDLPPVIPDFSTLTLELTPAAGGVVTVPLQTLAGEAEDGVWTFTTESFRLGTGAVLPAGGEVEFSVMSTQGSGFRRVLRIKGGQGP